MSFSTVKFNLNHLVSKLFNKEFVMKTRDILYYCSDNQVDKINLLLEHESHDVNENSSSCIIPHYKLTKKDKTIKVKADTKIFMKCVLKDYLESIRMESSILGINHIKLDYGSRKALAEMKKENYFNNYNHQK